MRLDQIFQRLDKFNKTEKMAILIVLLKEFKMHGEWDIEEPCICPCLYCDASCRQNKEAIKELQNNDKLGVYNTCDCQCCSGD